MSIKVSHTSNVLYFVGGTAVGKTFLAQALEARYRAAGKTTARIDLSPGPRRTKARTASTAADINDAALSHDFVLVCAPTRQALRGLPAALKVIQIEGAVTFPL